MADIEDSHRQKQICLDAQSNYLKAASTQRTRYQRKLEGFIKEYAVEDTVGIKIHNADRTNTEEQTKRRTKTLQTLLCFWNTEKYLQWRRNGGYEQCTLLRANID